MTAETDSLISGCQGLVRSIAWKIHRTLPSHVDLEELIAYGNLGLAQAAHRFDRNSGNQFTTFAYHRIRGAILDGLKQMSWFKLIDYHGGRYAHLSQDAIDGEVGDADTNNSLDRQLEWLEDVCGRVAVVNLLSQHEHADAIEDARAESPTDLVEADDTRRMLLDLVEHLDPPADEVIRLAYYEGVTLREVGKQFGRDKSWASRVHIRALKTLARMVDN